MPLVNQYGVVVSEFEGETSKAKARRLKENWFEQFAPEQLSGLDIGAGEDPLNHTFRRFDQEFGDQDATYLSGVPDNIFHTVYASHVLEHIQYPQIAIKNWWRVTKTNGHLIVIVPHRDLYENKKMLPSIRNPDHKYFWLPDKDEPPCTKNLWHEVNQSTSNAEVVCFETRQDNYRQTDDHPEGEYSIEMIIKKIG